MANRVCQVIRQTQARIFDGITKLPGKIVSLFEPHTEIVRKGKASKPTEFGKLVQIQEAENQIITHYAVFDERPSDSELLLPAVEAHQRVFGRPPVLIAADAGFYSQVQAWACKRIRPSHVPSNHRMRDGSSRSRRWADSIIVTSAGPPEARSRLRCPQEPGERLSPALSRRRSFLLASSDS